MDSTSSLSLIDLQDLQLDDVRALLEHAGQDSRQEGNEPPLTYLQRLINGLCELSLKDPLTGLGNRRHFIAALQRAIEVVARSGDAILLLLVDIDHFKNINDTHGHPIGDQVLQAVAACLGHCVRPMDTVVRYGGEEFAMILPHCQPNCGRAVAERVRRTIESLTIPVTPRVNLHITISIGGAYAPEWVRSTTDLWIERADLQLYRAKAGGRNQAFLDLPHEISVSAEEKSLLFSHFLMDQAATMPDNTSTDGEGTTGNPPPRVNA
ncbi:GGDEF domain-containing protein [Thiobacillus sp.]